MIKYECDRCHKDFEDFNERRVVKIFHDGMREEMYDICPECMKDLQAYVERADGQPDSCGCDNES